MNRGWRFWLRTGWWAFTHPFSPTDDNPGVKATMDDLIADVRRLERVRIADELREECYYGGIAAERFDRAADFIERSVPMASKDAPNA